MRSSRPKPSSRRKPGPTCPLARRRQSCAGAEPARPRSNIAPRWIPASAGMTSEGGAGAMGRLASSHLLRAIARRDALLLGIGEGGFLVHVGQHLAVGLDPVG